MTNHQRFIDACAKATIDAVDVDEAPNTNAYREAALMLLPFVHHLIEWCDSPRKRWAAAFAIGHPMVEGRTMTDVAAKLNISRAMLSHLARRYIRETGLPPSDYMRGNAASATARSARQAVVRRNNTLQQPK